ncbi:hypothetical protein DY000_02021524 [Brassica cretica]|uniref:Uncharacterized protein n=1 Tax=Brassica cretica TaxID=69181 RepID=A0ABQ7E640_BRACR|nr:hypothetical protein DY000_02021524 [Brassica cretica]
MHAEEYDEDYKEERATKYKTILDEEDKLLHHSSWKRNAPSIDRSVSASIDTHPHQTSQKRASTDIAYYPSIDTGVGRVREGDYSIGSLADDHHHESYAVETAIHEPGADEPHEGFTYEELLNMQRRDEDEFGIFRDPNGYGREIDGHALQVSREDIADILQMANGADNLFMQQHTVPAFQQKVTKEFYDTAGSIDNHLKQKYRHPTRPSIDVDVPPSIDRRPEFGRRAFDLLELGNFIRKRTMTKRASRDEHIYICLPEHASSFTQTKLVPEIYTKDEINEMFYGVCGAEEKNEGDFQLKLDGVYYPLNDSISWLTTCMEEMRQDIAKIQHAADKHRPASIDNRLPASIDNRFPTSVDDNLPHSYPMESQPDFHTRTEIDQLIEDIYRTLVTIEERLDRRCDDIYFPMDLSMSALISQIEAIQREIVEIHGYIARRPEASASIDRRNNKSTDIPRQTSVDEATNRVQP